MKNTIPYSGQEKHMAEEIWLNYFNRYLRDHGVISDHEFTRMAELILKRKRKSPPQKEA